MTRLSERTNCCFPAVTVASADNRTKCTFAVLFFLFPGVLERFTTAAPQGSLSCQTGGIHRHNGILK